MARIVVYVEGGIVQEIVSDTPGIEVVKLDYDTEGADDDELTEDQAGVPVFALREDARLDANYVAEVFKAVGEE